MKTKLPQVADKNNALAHVCLPAPDALAAQTPREQLLQDIGAVNAHGEGMMLQRLLWAERLNRLKEGKLYKDLGMSWGDVCQHLGFSVDTADRMVSDLREFGHAYFELKQIAPRLTREAFRAIQPLETDDGCLVIGGTKLALTKANYPAIQAELAIQQEKLTKQAESLSEQKSALDGARLERDNARKGAKGLQEKLNQIRKDHEERFAAHSPALRQLLEADEAIRYAAGKITAAKSDPELTEDERQMATEFGFAAVKVLERAFAIYGADIAHHGMIPDGKLISDEMTDRMLTEKGVVTSIKGHA